MADSKAKVPILEKLCSQLASLELEHSLKGAEGTEPRPRVVAAPRSVTDVAFCVQAAQSLSCSVSVVGGNHSGYGGLGDLVLEMEHHFTAIAADVTSNLVRVEAGVKLKSLAAKAAESELVVPLGTAPTVGVGLILQGGVGHSTRRLGLALDAIHSVQLVTASGEVLTLSSDSCDEHKDLFWAVCGCGPNFGVVTSLELKASKLKSCRATRRVFHVPSESPSEAASVVQRYMLRSKSLPRDCCADCCVYLADGSIQVGIYDFNLGCEVPPVDAGSAESVLELVDEGLNPVQLMDIEPYLCEQPPGVAHRGFLSSRSFFTRALFFGRDADISEVLVERLLKAPSRHCYFHFQHMGGAVADGSSLSSAFLARDAEWSLVITAAWTEDEEDCSFWVREVVKVLLPLALGCYATDLGPDPEDVELAHRTFGGHAERLLLLKQKWDPNNMFRHGFPLCQLGQAT